MLYQITYLLKTMKINHFGRARILSAEELDTLIDAIPYSPHKVCCVLLRYTGARVSEALQSKWEYYTETHFIYPAPTTKTKQTRKIPINNKLRLELDTWKAYIQPENESEYIFKGRFGSHLTRQSMDKKLKLYSPYKGVSTHTFRRSCLTALNRAKVPLNVIASLSGHASMSALQLYLGIDEKEQAEAINLL